MRRFASASCRPWDVFDLLIGLKKGSTVLWRLIENEKIALQEGHTFARRVKFTFRKSDIDQLVKDLVHARRGIEHIEDRVARLEQTAARPAKSPESLHLTRIFSQIQNRANTLYSAIQSAWSGSCHPAHSARLLLHSWPNSSTAEQAEMRVTFLLLFQSGSDQGPDDVRKVVEVQSPASSMESSEVYAVRSELTEAHLQGCC